MHRLARRLAALALAILAGNAAAQAWPDRPIRLINGSAAGGQLDVVARALALRLQSQFGQPVVVENKPGATEIIAADACSKAAPNGLTLCILTQQPIANAPNLVKRLPYDPVNAFTPIGLIGVPLSMIMVNSEVGVKSFNELMAHAKKNPGALNWGSNGMGSTSHLLLESIRFETGWKVTHVPFPSASAALQGIVSNQVQLQYTPPGGAGRAFMDSGKLIPLAFAGTRRLPNFPNVPTLGEVGLGKYLMRGWFALMGPAGLPQDIVDKLNKATVAFVELPETQAMLEAQTVGPLTSTPAEAATFIRTNTEIFNAAFKRAGIAPE